MGVAARLTIVAIALWAGAALGLLVGHIAWAADTDSHFVSMTIPVRDGLEAPGELSLSVGAMDFLMETAEVTVYRSATRLRYGTNDMSGRGRVVSVSVADLPAGITVEAYGADIVKTGTADRARCGTAFPPQPLSATPVAIIGDVRGVGCQAVIHYLVTVNLAAEPGTHRLVFHWSIGDG